MRKWVAAALSALPFFLFGCVIALLGSQFRLASLQAATTGYGWPAGSKPRTQAKQLAAVQQQLHLQQQQQQQQQAEAGHRDSKPLQPVAAVKKVTLVIYILNEDDPIFKDNFEYFLLAGMQESSRCAYVVVVQLKAFKAADQLPAVPAVQYLYYGGKCLEWGMVGWVLQSGQVNWQQYQYFVLLSSAVRGPFMPSYLDGQMHWTQPFISRLSDRVKLVGPVISCAPAPSDPTNVSARWAHNPHIPLHAVATDRVGLDVLMHAGVFDCHTSLWQDKYASELRAASALFEAGYSIDCLLVRYQGVDWTHPSARGCNRAWDPTGPGDSAYDGLSLDPMEVMFARVNSPMLEARVTSVLKALKYSEWALAVASEAAGLTDDYTNRVTSNAYVDNRGVFKLPRILKAFVRGRECFDVPYFVEHNRDFFGKGPVEKVDAENAWKFFVYIAQFEDRPFRYTCAFNYSTVATPAF